jgi:hypothetical protein
MDPALPVVSKFRKSLKTVGPLSFVNYMRESDIWSLGAIVRIEVVWRDWGGVARLGARVSECEWENISHTSSHAPYIEE